MADNASPKKKPMVGWYDPRQLINTGLQVLASDLIGTRFDARREEALAAKQDEPLHDYSARQGDFWFDFMADTGDGWDPTFAMAKLVSREVSVEGHKLPRGDFLILGGDQIYPYASKEEYQDRLIGPLNAAAKDAGEAHVDLYAIPGNHDWYDGLISFLRLFTQRRGIGDWKVTDKTTGEERSVGGWRTRQARSYFALKLPSRWWLWAVDTQLEADLDQPQVDYFQSVVRKMDLGDRLIVCLPEPDWLYGKMKKNPGLMNNMDFLLTHVIDKSMKVYLTISGDLHHYRRHQSECEPTRHKIVAGGGGAFLHPTHRHKVSSVKVHDGTFALNQDTQFPSESTSFWLTFKNLLAPWLNPWFGTLTAPVYLFFAWQLTSVKWGLKPLFELTVSQPAVMLALVAVALVGFFYFSVGSRKLRLLWGTLAHGGAHIAAVLALAHLITCWFGADPTDWHTALPRLLGLLIGGYLLGPIIMGLYLLISLNVFGTHHNEAFSALRIKHYKNFLRMCVRANGDLDIYPVGVPHLNKPPILIEGPITITPYPDKGVDTGTRGCSKSC